MEVPFRLTVRAICGSISHQRLAFVLIENYRLIEADGYAEILLSDNEDFVLDKNMTPERAEQLTATWNNKNFIFLETRKIKLSSRYQTVFDKNQTGIGD
ncbi:unnamed protein product [Nesidiocoris tenuis]|uniref:Uncharacterized protein n=1 Tax=Nesidiocoris tenuis TaxID=355587 RepID=A0A6H5G935_9HEMI|nr:unnamed protein product [Nesidiocoris tenuis]